MSSSRAFLYAVIHTESRFDPDATSSVEAMVAHADHKDAFEWAQFRMGEERELTLSSSMSGNKHQYGSYIYSLLIGEFGSQANGYLRLPRGAGQRATLA